MPWLYRVEGKEKSNVDRFFRKILKLESGAYVLELLFMTIRIFKL
jgi:hypothetical protein